MKNELYSNLVRAEMFLRELKRYQQKHIEHLEVFRDTISAAVGAARANLDFMQSIMNTIPPLISKVGASMNEENKSDKNNLQE